MKEAIYEKTIKNIGGKIIYYLGRIRMVVLKVLSLPRNQELLDINTYSTNLNIYKCNNVNITLLLNWGKILLLLLHVSVLTFHMLCQMAKLAPPTVQLGLMETRTASQKKVSWRIACPCDSRKANDIRRDKVV